MTIDVVFGIKGIVLPCELQACDHLLYCLHLVFGRARVRRLRVNVLTVLQQNIPLAL
jgi:hypothetical protein